MMNKTISVFTKPRFVVSFIYNKSSYHIFIGFRRLFFRVVGPPRCRRDPHPLPSPTHPPGQPHIRPPPLCLSPTNSLATGGMRDIPDCLHADWQSKMAVPPAHLNVGPSGGRTAQ